MRQTNPERARAIHSLASLPHERLCEALAEGLSLLAEHVARLEESHAQLHETKQARAFLALQVLAEEEAAKFMILLDAVRAPRRDQGVKVRQRRFHEHLPKGIYVRVYDMSPATYGEVVRFVDMMREKYYLDGPNEVD